MKKVVEKILSARYSAIQLIGDSFYLVRKGNLSFGPGWSIYSTRKKQIICGGFDSFTSLTPGLLLLQSMGGCSGSRSINYHVFSVKKGEIVLTDKYSAPQYCEKDRLICFKGSDSVDDLGGDGLFSVNGEKFIIEPIYRELVHLEEGLYYGVKENRGSREESYFLITIDKEGNAHTRKTEKLA